MNKDISAQVVVLGSGPAGYSAAFRCADLGLDTVLVESFSKLGGVCLNVGCIPSKYLLHIAQSINNVKQLSGQGIININDFSLNINKIRNWKEDIIVNLTNGLSSMAKRRKIRVIRGFGCFTTTNNIIVKNKEELVSIKFKYVIVATGSIPKTLPFISFDGKRVWNSTHALKLMTIPNRFLIIGAGIIGLEMATIYNSLGSEVDIIDVSNKILPLVDEDIIDVFIKSIKKDFNISLETNILEFKNDIDSIFVKTIDKFGIKKQKCYDAVLVVIGRQPSIEKLGIRQIGVNVNDLGFIQVNSQFQTNIDNIYAIGDVIGEPMLAHKGIHEAHIAAEVIAGYKHYFETQIIPSVCYTNPEVAWVGKTEKTAKKNNINYESVKIPWTALGRAVSSDVSEGITKLIFNKDTRKIIGGLIIGHNAGELLGEISLAIEMGCDAEDIALTIHAHPTLHESIRLAAELFLGTITDLPNLKK